jgi:hypothetical protein
MSLQSAEGAAFLRLHLKQGFCAWGAGAVWWAWSKSISVSGCWSMQIVFFLPSGTLLDLSDWAFFVCW